MECCYIDDKSKYLYKKIITTYTGSTTIATYHVSTYRIILYHKCKSTVSTIIMVQKECMHVKSQIILVSVHLFHQVRVFFQNDLSLHFKSWGQLSAVDAEIHRENAEFLQLEDKKRTNITISTQPSQSSC